jgi:Fe-S-cluster containining protein
MTTWYAETGVTFGCTRCGACCKRPGFVFLTPFEADRIAERLVGQGATAAALMGELWVEDEDGLLVIDVPERATCPLLGEDGCTVHDIKPMQCATYPFWPEIMKSRKAWKYEAKRCEGIHPGPVRPDASTEADTYSGEAVDAILAMRARTRNA